MTIPADDLARLAALAERAGLGLRLVEQLGRYPTAAEVMERVNAAVAADRPAGAAPSVPGSDPP